MSARIVLLTFLFWIPGSLFAESRNQVFSVPTLTSPVVDQAGIFSEEGRIRIETLLRTVHSSGGSQIAVLTVPSLDGLDIEEASIKVVDTWKLGRKGQDDGILLMVAPTERRLRIEVGRGREGDLTDAYARRIIDQVIAPTIRRDGFDMGILLGVAAIIQKTDPKIDLEGNGVPRPREVSGRHRGQGLSLVNVIMLLLFLIFPLLRILSWFGFLPRHGIYRSSGYSDWGGGFGGRGSGGGYSGGGGGFSGGGSSGSW